MIILLSCMVAQPVALLLLYSHPPPQQARDTFKERIHCSVEWQSASDIVNSSIVSLNVHMIPWTCGLQIPYYIRGVFEDYRGWGSDNT